jgi:simple sugar transport system permease protein
MNRARSVLAFLRRIEGLPIAMVLLLLYAAFNIAAPQAYGGNFLIYASFLQTVPKYLICALGLTLVITAGEIDLSFPAIIAFSGFVFTWAFKNIDSPMGAWIGIALALFAGGLVGFVNGILVAKIGVPSIMATLAAQFFWYGVTVLLADGKSIPILEVRDHVIHGILVGRLFGVIPAQAIWALVLAVILWFILNRHTFGEAILFIGDNPNVASVMGINVESTRIKLFTLNGVITAFAAIIVTIDINTFFPTQGNGFLLLALAGVFIGGTSIAGGQGSVFGTLFGTYIIGSLEGGVVSSGISGYWVQLVEGFVMGAVVILNVILEKQSISRLSNRFRHWGLSSRSNIATEALPKDADVLEP